MYNVFSGTFLFSLAVSLIVTTITTPIFIFLFKKYKILIDDPKQHIHPAIIHTKPIPRGGGLPFYLGVLVSGIIFLPHTKLTLILFIASLIALLIGLIDDKVGDFSRYIRFLANIFCALLVVGSGISIPFITNPFGGILHLDTVRISFSFFGTHSILLLSDVIAGLWLVWVMNMLNWSKGVDGQMPGIVAISAFVIGILSLRFASVDSHSLLAAQLSFIIAGASIGFLFYNFYPAKIFPGYGATSIYLLLSVVSILSSAKLATAILVMGVPMVDGIFTLFRRLLSGKSVFKGDKKHLHHLLLQKGWSQRRIALFYWLVSAILGTVALLLNSKGKLFALCMLAVVVTGALLFLHFSTQKDEKNKIV